MGFFAIIELILKLIGMWNQFGDFMDARRKAEAEERRQAREKAADDLDKAETDEEIFDAQKRLNDNSP